MRCAHAIAMQHEVKLALVVGKPRPLPFRMPQMQHAGCKASVLAPHAAADEPNEQVGILAPPTGESRIEAVDPLEVLAKERHVAAARAHPALPAALAQRPQRQPDQRSDAIDLAAPAARQKAPKPPELRLQSVAQNPLA